MWTIFKVSLEFVTIWLLFYVLVFWRGMWGFSSLTSNRTCTGRQSFQLWTARAAPVRAFKWIYKTCVPAVTFYWSKQIMKPAQLQEERKEALSLGERSGRVTLKKACAMGDADAGIWGNCLLCCLTQCTFWPHTKYTHHHLSPWLITQPYKRLNAICSIVDGPRDDHTKWSKSEKDS